VIDTLAVGDWAVTWYSNEGTGQAAALPSPLLTVQNVTVCTLMASVPTSYYSIVAL